MHKHYRLRTIKNPKGDIRWYIEMDKEFIEPINDQEIYPPFGPRVRGALMPLTVSDIVTKGNEWNFNMVELGCILDQIERIVRKNGLRKERN